MGIVPSLYLQVREVRLHLYGQLRHIGRINGRDTTAGKFLTSTPTVFQGASLPFQRHVKHATSMPTRRYTSDKIALCMQRYDVAFRQWPSSFS